MAAEPNALGSVSIAKAGHLGPMQSGCKGDQSMTAILTITGAVVTVFFLLDATCYLWLRHNEAIRLVPTSGVLSVGRRRHPIQVK